MKAIRVLEPGGSDELILEEIDQPTCGPDEVIVQIKVAGINYIDIYIRSGLYKSPAYPYTPGKEGSGVVVDVGRDVQDIELGDHVAFCFARTGTYAEYAAVPANQIYKLNSSIPFDVAAAAMLQGLTAYYLTHYTFRLNHTHTALIHAGAGGVGLLLVQIAKLREAKSIVTVSTEEKAKLVKEMGANDVILYSRESFYQRVMSITNGVGVSVVYDAVGKTTFDDSLKCLMYRGMLVSYGQASGAIPTFDIASLAEKSLYLTRPNLAHYILTKKELTEMCTALFDLIHRKKLKITIGKTYPLEEAAQAHDDLEGRKTIGKSLLIIEA